MKSEFENIPRVDNKVLHRFELTVNGLTAFIDYESAQDGVLSLVHTEAPEALTGTGAAAALVEKTFLKLEQSGILIQPFCPYIFAFIKRHPEWKKLVYKGFPGYGRL